MKSKIIHLLPILILFSAGSLLAQKQINYRVEIDSSYSIHYGSTIPVKVFQLKKKKKRLIPFHELESKFHLEAIGASWIRNCTDMNHHLCHNNFDTIFFDEHSACLKIDGHPADSSFERISIVISKDEFSYHGSVNFNYKGPLYIDFSGAKGVDGENGNESSIQVFRHGTYGNDGDSGWNGFPGKNITVRIFKDHLAADGKKHTGIYVDVSGTGRRYFYKTPYPENGILIYACGGYGGNGGNGTNGGEGRDGTAEKEPGAGGKGGDGGNGGDGGIGGEVELLVHPNAESVIPYIQVKNDGGQPGLGGIGGTGGMPGKPFGNQNEAPKGVDGKNGSNGNQGNKGAEPKITVIPF